MDHMQALGGYEKTKRKELFSQRSSESHCTSTDPQ